MQQVSGKHTFLEMVTTLLMWDSGHWPYSMEAQPSDLLWVTIQLMLAFTQAESVKACSNQQSAMAIPLTQPTFLTLPYKEIIFSMVETTNQVNNLLSILSETCLLLLIVHLRDVQVSDCQIEHWYP